MEASSDATSTSLLPAPRAAKNTVLQGGPPRALRNLCKIPCEKIAWRRFFSNELTQHGPESGVLGLIADFLQALLPGRDGEAERPGGPLRTVGV